MFDVENRSCRKGVVMFCRVEFSGVNAVPHGRWAPCAMGWVSPVGCRFGVRRPLEGTGGPVRSKDFVESLRTNSKGIWAPGLPFRYIGACAAS